jgi:hypothetical protein
MTTRFFFGLVLVASFLIPSLEAKDIIRDKSPDGKFALRFTRDDKGFWEAAIINLKSKDEAVGLEIYQNGYIEGAHLVWSKDSQRVAYFEPDRRGGSTHIYFRNGSEFDEVEYPEADVPECSANDLATNHTNSPKEWLKSGALVVAVKETWLTDHQNEHHCSETVTIAFDANHKASVQSITNKKSG